MDEIVQYPKWMYHATETARVVADEAEQEALGEGWQETPVDLTKPETAVTAETSDKQPASGSAVVLTKMTKAQLADFAKTDLQLELDVDALSKAQMIDQITEALK